MNESPADEKSRTTIKPYELIANKGSVQNSLTLSF